MNWIHVERSIALKSRRPGGYPTHVLLEPTTCCNLSCTLCPVTTGMERAGVHMDMTLFEHIIDEIGEYVFLLMLWDWGEPFMNPAIYDMIAYAKRRRIKIVSSTNGHLFADKRHAERLVRSGIDTIIFAVDGITQESYERYRASGDLDTVMQGIRNVAAVKRTLHWQTPVINFRFIVMRHNEHEVPLLQDFVKNLGADVLTLKTLNPYSNDTYHERRSQEDVGPNEFLPVNPAYRRFRYLPDQRTRIRVKQNACKNLWNAPAIHANGAVCPCTYDYNEQYVFGDLNTTDFKDIWFGQSYQEYRDQFRRHWTALPFCAECSYGYEGGSCIDETVRKPLFL
ncbi:MAG: radical SAM protein [bacterium]|nr:radical SAM protein [bacterium]